LSASSRATVLRLNALDLRARLRRQLQNPLLAEPIDPARFTISDADIAEAVLLFLSSLLCHDFCISVNLTGDHDPSARQIFQGRGFGFVLRQG
jgi:hypothetical protein